MNSLCLQRKITVNRNLQDCYRYLLDFSSCEQWDPGVCRAEKISPGAVVPGTRFDVTLRVLGRQLGMQYQLQAAAENHSLDLTGEGDGFRVRDRIQVEALADNRTRIIYRADMALPGITRLAGPGLRYWGERMAEASMDGLQAALDADGPVQRQLATRLREKLILPAAAEFTRLGYRRLPSRGLSRFMDGKTVVITGPTRGLGLAAAQMLGRLGARLVLVGRDVDRLTATESAIVDFAGPVDIDCFEAELSLVSECERVAAAISRKYPSIDVLINNAGALSQERRETAEGYELSMAVNLLAPYALAMGLQNALVRAQGRLINVVSGGLYLQSLDLADLNYSQRAYDGTKAYAQAKRALLSVTRQWAQTPQWQPVSLHAVHPGWAATPGVADALPGFNRLMSPWLRDARMGADSIVWLASHPALGKATHSGQFWFDRQPRPTDVLPGTRVAESEALALMDWLASQRQRITKKAA